MPMIPIPLWLDRVLLDGATLDLHHPEARHRLALAILEGLPQATMALAAKIVLLMQAQRSAPTPEDVAQAITDGVIRSLEV